MNLWFEVDDGIGRHQGQRKFRAFGGEEQVLGLDRAGGGVEPEGREAAEEADTEAFDVAVAIVEQGDAAAGRVARQAGDDDVGAVDAEQTFLVAEFLAELVGVGGGIAGLGLDVEVELGIGGGEDAEEEIAADEQIEIFAGGGGAVVEEADVGEGGSFEAGMVARSLAASANLGQSLAATFMMTSTP